MARPSNTDERRSQIVGGLAHVLARQGYAGATIPDIARAARLAPGLVHYHFADKRSVLVALVEQLALRLRGRVARRDAVARTARDRLIAFIDGAVARGADADPDAIACWVSVSAEAVRDTQVRAVVDAAATVLVGDLERRVRAALREAGCNPRSARTRAAVLWSAIQGSFVVAATTPALIPNGAMAPALRALALAWLKEEDA